MLKSYEAIYDHGHIQWLGEVPRFKRVRVVLVADDACELDQAERVSSTENGSRLVEFLPSVSAEARQRFAEKFGDPVVWQRQQRGGVTSIEATTTRLSDNQADALLAETAGAWGNRSLAEIDALLAEQRSLDWGDE